MSKQRLFVGASTPVKLILKANWNKQAEPFTTADAQIETAMLDGAILFGGAATLILRVRPRRVGWSDQV